MPKLYKNIVNHVALLYNHAWKIKNYRYVRDVSRLLIIFYYRKPHTNGYIEHSKGVIEHITTPYYMITSLSKT